MSSRVTPSQYFVAPSRAKRNTTSGLVSVRLSDDLLRRLADVGNEQGLAMSDTIRLVLERGLTASPPEAKEEQMTDTTNLHIYFVLDRSGSMESIASDVVGGFNAFLADQQADGTDALMTLVQFDSQDAHEILAEAEPIADVPRLTSETFAPRGGTPLYDAMGHTIADATIHAEGRRSAGKPGEEILFVTFTDGEENQSREYNRATLFDLVKKREKSGWTFVYLGANQDAYAEGGRIGYSAGNTQNFDASARGTEVAFASLSKSVGARRAKMRSGEAYDKGDLFEGAKPAEDLPGAGA